MNQYPNDHTTRHGYPNTGQMPPPGYPPQYPGPQFTPHPPGMPPSQPIQPPQKRKNGWLIAAIAISAVVCFGVIGAIASPFIPWLKPVDGYLFTNDTTIGFIHWTEKNGQVSGAWESTVYEDNKIKSRSLPFTGTYDKNTGALGMNIDFTLVNVNAQGTVKDDTLTLEIQVPMNEPETRTFKAASNAEYKAALDTFKAKYPGS